jgi:hypothetical protein
MPVAVKCEVGGDQVTARIENQPCRRGEIESRLGEHHAPVLFGHHVWSG